MTSVNANYTFTEREDDGNGLLYYRNRYYSSTMKRFISEAPIGLNGGINQYAYVMGNPLMMIDPLGLSDLNMFPIGSELRKWADGINPPQYFTITAHGDIFGNILDENRNIISMESLIQKIKSSPTYKDKKNAKILLLVCHAGSGFNDEPQQLANIFGVDVLASSYFVTIRENGQYNSSELYFSKPETGTWIHKGMLYYVDLPIGAGFITTKPQIK